MQLVTAQECKLSVTTSTGTHRNAKSVLCRAWISARIRPRVELVTELPLLAAHGALLLQLLGCQPLQDAVHVETVPAAAYHCKGDRKVDGDHVP